MNHTIHVGDCRNTLKRLPEQSVQCVVTSPPYWGLRDYGVEGQLGMEPTPEEYVANLVEAFREVWRVLRNDGTLWVNLGDSYGGGTRDHNSFRRDRGHVQSGCRPKDLVGIPWRVAFALQTDGWILRQDIVWAKPNPMPESVRDRCTKSHEYVFLLAKQQRYFWDADAIAEEASSDVGRGVIEESQKYGDAIDICRAHSGWMGGTGKTRNKRSVWKIPTKSFNGAHFAVFPPALVEPCILAGSRVDDTILDPFGGAGTVSLVAESLERNSVLCELNPEYAELSRKRIAASRPMFANVDVLLSEPDLTATAHTG